MRAATVTLTGSRPSSRPIDTGVGGDVRRYLDHASSVLRSHEARMSGTTRTFVELP
jgi:hypothetical protein